MPEFVKISGPKQNKLREKSGNSLYLAVVEGIRGEFGMLSFPFLRTHALYFSGTLLQPTLLSSGRAKGFLMFPFVFPSVPFSLPFTWQIIAFFRQKKQGPVPIRKTGAGKNTIPLPSVSSHQGLPLLSPKGGHWSSWPHPVPFHQGWGQEALPDMELPPGVAWGVQDAAAAPSCVKELQTSLQNLCVLSPLRQGTSQQSHHQHEENSIPGEQDGSNKDLWQHW